MFGHQLRLGRPTRAHAQTFNALTAALFRNGVQGVAYDVSDLSTLFQDAAGTVPVTAAGQPVRLMLDKSKGLVRGSERVTSPTVVGVPIGGPAFTDYVVGPPTVAGKTYHIRLTVSNYSGSGSVSISGGAAQWGYNPTSVAGAFLFGNGTLDFIITCVAVGDLRVFTRSTNTCTFSNISVRELPGNHVTFLSDAARPFLRLNATTGAYYLETDGVDDGGVTQSINFTGTDKVSVFAGVRKMSDAAAGILIELSADLNANNGSFYVLAPRSGIDNSYLFASRGTTSVANPSGSIYPAPVSSVVSGVADISAPRNTIRVNGSEKSTLANSQGVGNYGNYPLYLFRRGGTSLPFNGHFYGAIITGRLTTAAETRNVERMLAKRVGVQLT